MMEEKDELIVIFSSCSWWLQKILLEVMLSLWLRKGGPRQELFVRCRSLFSLSPRPLSRARSAYVRAHTLSTSKYLYCTADSTLYSWSISVLLDFPAFT